MKSQPARIVAFSLIGLGGADLFLGTTGTPLPIVGEYLSQQMDLVMIGIGTIILVFF